MERDTKKSRGITLIALVLTIVVLLILAAVSISMLGGENGIISQAQKSKEQTEIGEEKDFINLAVSAIKANKISRGDTSEITSDELQNEIKNYTDKATVTGSGILTITYISGREYEVDGNGNLNIPEQSYDGMYSEAGLEGKIAPSDLFEYEKIDDTTARILRIKPEYCNIEGYNPHTDAIDLNNTDGYIIYKGEPILELLVIPYEVVLEDGKTYKITGVQLYVKGPMFMACGASLNEYQYPNIDKIVCPNTIENMNEIDTTTSYPILNGGSLKEIVLSKNLKKIGDYLFYECRNLTNIKIPNSVTSIGKESFYYCNSLTSIKIPNSVTSIGEKAFNYCDGLTDIDISENITRIEEATFKSCKSIQSIDIPESVTSIGDYAFGYCESLKNINIPESVTSIGGHAFAYCIGLKSMIISENLISIGNGAFAGWGELEKIEVSKNNSVYDSRENCNAIIKTETNELILGCKTTTILDGITSIVEYAFHGCDSLTSINIPESVTSIGGHAFAHCKSLTSIDIPEGITTICEWTFYGCDSLTSINIPNSVTSIEYDAFAYCKSLTSIDIPKGIKIIGREAFMYCVNLRYIAIPSSVTNILYKAFYGCKGLTGITIPTSVTRIDSSAFLFCDGLTTVNYKGTESQWKQISIGTQNDPLTSSTINYNHTGE